ncbi:hypothetical protein, partial [Maribacter sp.]|uniref:hypothetical protein n=1 Tax=Maribacter sp. TaxID=1897614 RepID=UPI0032997C29
MKDKFEKLLTFTVLILVLYLIINILHLSWYVANPEGVFGFFYFLDVIRSMLTIILISTVALVGVWYLIYLLISFFKKSINKTKIFKTLVAIIAVIIISAFNHVWVNGFSTYFSFKLADKYSYIKTTEDYLSEGKTEEALEYSIKAYEKEKSRKISSIFFLTKLFSKSEYDKREKLFARYASTINYGLCLKEIISKDISAENYFQEALTLTNSSLFTDLEKQNLKIFPTLNLAEIYQNSGEYQKSDTFFNHLYVLNENAETNDIEYLINTNFIFSEQASRIGDFEKFIQLNKQSLDLYKNSELSSKSSFYLTLLLINAAGELFNENYSKAADLIIEATPIAEEKNDKPIYQFYLGIKGQYCALGYLNSFGNEKVLKSNLWTRLKNLFSAEQILAEKMKLEAEMCYKEALNLTQDYSGENTFAYNSQLIQLAQFYFTVGDNKLAKKHYDKALRILNPKKEEYKDLYYQAYLKSLIITSSQSSIEVNRIKEIEDFVFNKVNENYIFFTEEEKEKYAIYIDKYINQINELHIQNNSDSSTELLYNNILAIKNIALYSNSNLRTFLNEASVSLKLEYNNLLAKKKELELGVENTHLKKAKVLNQLEKAFNQKLNNETSFKPFQPRNINWSIIKQKLLPNEVAIEIINIPISKFPTSNSQYYALVIQPNSIAPELIPLFKEDALKQLMNAKGNTQDRINSIYGNDNIYNLIIKPLEAYLTPKSIIYLSKSGLLHNISFPALLKNKDWELHILGSTRQIINKNKLSELRSVALFGGINYNSVNSDSTNINRSLSTLSENVSKGFKNENFKDLKYTSIEIK